MGPPRKGGKKKAGGARKGSKTGTKKNKQWDDYDPTAAKAAKRSYGSDDDAPTPTARPAKKAKSSSMFAQWKDKKISQRQKERKFVNKTGAKKAEQRALYQEQKKRRADTAYSRKGDASAKEEPREEEEEESSDSEEDSGEEGEEEGKGRKRKSVFDQFVQAFQPSKAVFDEENEEDDDGEDEYEETEVDEDGNPIEPEEEYEDGEDEIEDAEDHTDEDVQLDEEEEEEEEELQDGDANDEAESSAFDPCRQRYLLTDFSEKDAKQMDAAARKFVPLSAGNVDHAHIPTSVLEEFNVSFRRGNQREKEQQALQTLLAPSLNIRSRLLQTWKAAKVDPEARRDSSPLEYTLFKQLSSYTDVFFAGQTQALTRPLRRLSAMHALNHVVKSRDTVARNNERLRKRDNRETGEEKEDEDEPSTDAAAAREALGVDDEKEYRDQGFCRASVLILMPLRSAASQFVSELLELLPPTVNLFHNKDRFFTEYGNVDAEDDEENDDEQQGGSEDLKEWQRVFSEGNNDDSFQIGISISRRAVRFYSDYRQADIIIASPLGLRQQLGDEVVDVAETQTISSEFLSSIEVCVLDSASLLLMQNIEHLRHVLQALNVKPKVAPNADFSRLREWNLSFLGAYFRQTIVFAHGVEPILQNLVNKCCKNQSGVIKYVRNYDSNAGESSASITRVVPQIKQIFQRMDLTSGRALSLTPAEEVELRFEYFQKHIFTPLLDNPRRHVLIFVPSYFDYVRIRNLFHDTMNEKLIRTVQCCEYTTPKQTSRARTTFFHGRCHVMLYTERFHFYHQYQMRGIHQIIWYGLPVMGEFYPEMLNMFEDPKAASDSVSDEGKSSVALFTRHDLFRLQRVVGPKRAERMCQSNAKKSTFLFC